MMNQEECRPKTDEELVALSLTDQGYFCWLVKRYEQKLARYVIRISGATKEEAEDILQEVFVKVYRNLNDFDPDLKFSSWIYRIAHNQVISHYRRQKARPRSVELSDELANHLSADLDLVKEIDSKILKAKVKNAIGNLDVKYREVLVLRFFEEKSYEEISDILKKPPGTVATLVNRAKKRLKNEMAKQKIIF